MSAFAKKLINPRCGARQNHLFRTISSLGSPHVSESCLLSRNTRSPLVARVVPTNCVGRPEAFLPRHGILPAQLLLGEPQTAKPHITNPRTNNARNSRSMCTYTKREINSFRIRTCEKRGRGRCRFLMLNFKFATESSVGEGGIMHKFPLPLHRAGRRRLPRRFSVRRPAFAPLGFLTFDSRLWTGYNSCRMCTCRKRVGGWGPLGGAGWQSRCGRRPERRRMRETEEIPELGPETHSDRAGEMP